jgi:pyridoxamine 5'-phosphate oxidase family protein
MFTEQEINYLKSQPLARIATVSGEGQPDVSPVGFEFDGMFFYVGGRNMDQTRKYRNISSGNSKVALVVDDLISVQPWNPRGIRIYGMADLIEKQGYAGPGLYLRIKPEISWSWNIEGSGTRKALHAQNRVLKGVAKEK